MVHIEIPESDLSVIAEIITDEISDLGMEIADTDRMEFRDQLKARRAALQRIVNQLRASLRTQAPHAAVSWSV